MFGGSIHYVSRLHSLRFEAPFTTFGGSIHIIFLTCALFLHRFLVSLHHQTTKVYGKEPFKQVRVAGGYHLQG